MEALQKVVLVSRHCVVIRKDRESGNSGIYLGVLWLLLVGDYRGGHAFGVAGARLVIFGLSVVIYWIESGDLLG